MNIDEVNEPSFKKRLLRVGLVYLVGFTLFFLASLIIITVNVKTREKIKIPEVIGKLFIDEHNNLNSLGLKIEIQKVNLVEYQYGEILAQSISPGKIVKEGSLFILTVNASKAIVPVPNLVGVSDSIAEKMLDIIPVGKAAYSLVPGNITSIPHNAPKGEVLAQYPPPGTPVLPDSPVMMLVSEGPEKLAQGFLIPEMKGSNIEIIKKLSYELKIPVKINTIPTYEYKKNGMVEKVDFGTNRFYTAGSEQKVWTVFVNRYVSEEANSFPNQFRWVDMSENNLKGKAVTVYERKVQEKGTYNNPAYVVMGDLYPVYYRSKVSIESWKGYQEAGNIISEDKTKATLSPDYKKTLNGIKI